MSLYLKDGKLLISGGKLAIDVDCCCSGTCAICFPPAEQMPLTLALSGFQDSNCTTPSSGCVINYTYSNLNGAYSVPNSAVVLLTDRGSSSGNYSDPGVLLERTTCPGTCSILTEVFAWAIKAVVDCVSIAGSGRACFQRVDIFTQKFFPNTFCTTRNVSTNSFGCISRRSSDTAPDCGNLTSECSFGTLSFSSPCPALNCDRSTYNWTATIAKA